MRRFLIPLAALTLGVTAACERDVPSVTSTAFPGQVEWRAAKQVVQLPSGLEMAYLDLGERDAPVLLLLHGFTDSSRAWSLVAPELAVGHRLIIPDLRGHGDSGRPASGYDYATLTGDVTALVDTLGLESFDLAGHSMGSMVAQHFAARQPSRVRHLVLIGSTVLRPIEPGSDLWQGLMSLEAPLLADQPFIVDWLVQTELSPARPAFTDAVKAEALLLPAHAWRQVAENFSSGPVGADLAAIEAPVLTLSGDADPLLDARHLASLAEAFPDGAHCVRKDGGHNLPYEDPAWTVARMRAFLDEAAENPCA